MTNEQLIEKFYSSFVAGDAERLVNCYTDDITFKDPAFGELKGDDANMWRILLKIPTLKYSNTLFGPIISAAAPVGFLCINLA